MPDADKTLGVAITADLTKFNEQVDKVGQTLLKLQEKKTAIKFAVPSEAQLKKLREYVDLVTRLNGAAAQARGGIVESYPMQRAARGAAGGAASGTVKVEAELKAVASTLRADIEEALKEPFDIHLRVANIEEIRKQIGAMEIPVTAAGGVPHAGPMPTTGPGNGMPTYRWSQGFQQQLANGGENMRKYIDNLYAGLNDARKIMGQSMLRDVGHVTDATEKAAQQFAAIAEAYGDKMEDLVQFGAQPVYPQSWPKEELRGKPRPGQPRPVVGGAAQQIMQAIGPENQQWFFPALQDFAGRAAGLYSTFGGSQRTASSPAAAQPIVQALRENTEAQKEAIRTATGPAPAAAATKTATAEATAKAVAEQVASIGLKESGQFTSQSLAERFAKALQERQRDSAAPGGITPGVTASVTPVWSESRKRWIDPKTGRIRKAPPITMEDGSLNVAGEPMLTDSDPVNRARQNQQQQRRRNRQRTDVPTDTTPLTLVQREIAGTGNKANKVPSRLAYRGVDFSDLLLPENVKLMMGMTQGISQENQGQMVRAITDNSPAAVLAGKAGLPFLKANEKGNLPGYSGLYMGMNPQDVAKQQVYERLRAARIPELEIESVVTSLFSGVKKGERPPSLPSGVASAAFPNGQTSENQVGALGYAIQQIVRSLGVGPDSLLNPGQTGDAPAGALVRGSGGYAAPDRFGRNGEALPFEVTAARLKSLAYSAPEGEFRDLLMQHLDNAVETAYQTAQVTGRNNRRRIDNENAVTPDERVMREKEAAERVRGLDAAMAQVASVWDDTIGGKLPTRYYDEQGNDLGPINNPDDETAPVTTSQLMRLRNLEFQQHIAGMLTDQRGNPVPAKSRPTAQSNRAFLRWLSSNGYERLGRSLSAPQQMYWSTQQMARRAYDTAAKSSDTSATRPPNESEISRPPRLMAQDKLDALQKTYRDLFGGEAQVQADPMARTTAARTRTKSVRGAAAYFDEKLRKWIDPTTGKEVPAAQAQTANRMYLSGEGMEHMGASPVVQAKVVGKKDLFWFQAVEAALRKEAKASNVGLRQLADPKVKIGLPFSPEKLEELLATQPGDDRRNGLFSTYLENPDFARRVHERATKSFRHKYGMAPEKRQSDLESEMAHQKAIIDATQRALRGEEYDQQYAPLVEQELARQRQYRETGQVGQTLDRRGNRRLRTGDEDARAYARAGGIAVPGTGPIDITGATAEAEARRQAGINASGTYSMGSEDIHPSLRSTGGGGGRATGNGRAPGDAGGDNSGRAFGGVIDVRIVGSTISVPVSLRSGRGMPAGASGNLTPESIRANFAANNPGASEEDIDAAVAALTGGGGRARGSGKKPKNVAGQQVVGFTQNSKGERKPIMRPVIAPVKVEGKDANAALAKQKDKEFSYRSDQFYSELYETTPEGIADTEREKEYTRLFDEAEERNKRAAKQAEEQRRRTEKGEAMYTDLFNRADAGVVPITPRESLGEDPRAQRKAEQEAERRAKKEAEYELLFDKGEKGAVPIYSRETMKPIGPRPVASSGPKPVTSRYAGPPTPQRLRAELGAAGVPEADIEALIAARTRPLGAGPAGALPGAETAEDLYVRQAQARLRKAANVTTSRSLGTTGIQLAQTFFGGKEQAAAATIAYSQEVRDLQRITDERRKLQSGLAQAQERVNRGTAIRASGKGGKELDAELADAAKAVEEHTNALKDNGLALDAQKKVVDTLAKDLPGVGAAFKNVAAGFVGGIGGGFIVSMMGAVTSLISETIEKGLIPQMDRRLGNGLLTAQQNRQFAGAVAQAQYTDLGVRQQMFELGFGTQGTNQVLQGLMLGAGGLAGAQQFQGRADAAVAARANLAQASNLGLPAGVSPQAVRTQGAFLSIPNPLGGYINLGGEGSYQEKLGDFLKQLPDRATGLTGADQGMLDLFSILDPRGSIIQRELQNRAAAPGSDRDVANMATRDWMLKSVTGGLMRHGSAEEVARQADIVSQSDDLKGFAQIMRDSGVVFTEGVSSLDDVFRRLQDIASGKQDLGTFFENASQRQLPNMMFQLQKQFEQADRTRQYGVGMNYYAQPHLAVGAGTNGAVPDWMASLGTDIDAQMQAAAQQGMNMIKAISPEADDLAGQYEDLNTQLQTLAQKSADIQKAQAWRDYTHNVYLAKRAVGDLAGLVGASGASEIGQLEKLNLLDQRRLQMLQFQQSQRALNYQRALAGFQYEGDTPEEAADRARIAREQTKYQQQELNINRRMFGRGVKIVDQQNLRAFNDAVYQLSELQKRFSEGNRLAQMAQTEQKVQEAQNLIQGKINNLIQKEEGLRAAQMDLASATADATGQTIKAVYDEAGKWLQKAADKYLVTIQTANDQAGIEVAPNSSGSPDDRDGTGDSNLSAFSQGGGKFVFNLSINNPVVRDDSDIRRIAAEVEKLINRKASLMGLQRLRAD